MTDAPSERTATATDAEMHRRVAEIIDEVRPYIRSDGGDIELVSVEGGVARVRMQGACVGCASSVFTLRFGIERRLKAEVPGFRMLEAVSWPAAKDVGSGSGVS